MDETRLKRLSFRAWRRGFREADLILGPFADRRGPSMTPAELEMFETLLEQPDPVLYAWIIEREPTPDEFDTSIMREIKVFRENLNVLRTGDRGA